MAVEHLLTQEDLHSWRACPRRFWLARQRDASVRPHGPGPDDALRATFPGAVSLAPPGTPAEWAQAVQRTTAWLGEPHRRGRGGAEGWALLGACLSSDDGALVRMDVMTRGAQGVRLLKVRYATVGDEADVDAVALWAHVAARCGLRVAGVGLLLVDTDFIYPGHGCHAGLFREVDLAPVLGSRPVSTWLVAMRRCERGPQPHAEPGPQCRQPGSCEFTSHCNPTVPAPAPGVASLEVFGRELAAELRLEGHADLYSVPEQRLSDPRHRRALRAVRQGGPVLEASVAGLFRAHGYPRHLLRMDTIGFAVPVWAGTQPYQDLPFQWTCDVEMAPGRWQELAFLAGDDGNPGDPRRAFAQTLLKALGVRGPVYAYNAGFERNRIRELAQRFADLAPALEALLPRIVDLFQIARTHYYHPSMCGSWSFKSICAAMAPELQAGQFLGEGETSAQAAFGRSLQRGLDPASRLRLRASLRAHGRRETEALRRMVAVFAGADRAPPA
jgi:Domain of unknown function(DUF2779)